MEQANEIAALLHDSAAGFFADIARGRDIDRALDVPRPVERGQWRQLAELGWLGLGLPERFDGSALGVAEACIISGELGRQALPLPYVACAVMPSLLLDGCADDENVRAIAEALGGGGRLVTLAWQEAVAALDPGQPRTRLHGGRISGSKLFVPAVESGSLLLVWVAGAGGVAIAAVEADAPGVRVERFATGAGAMSHIHFDDALLSGSAPLLSGASAERQLRRALDAGRIALSAELDGLAAACLEKTLQHLRDRTQFDRPLAAFQVLRHRAVDLHIATRLAGASWRHAAAAFDAEPDAAGTRAAIAAAKARCGDTALKVAKEAVQMHGAMGFTEETGVGRYLRAALHAAGWLGGATAQRRAFTGSQAPEVAVHD
jgi:alkylation response protein AidB-like acyl-CoA dehydrogenase